MGAAPGASEKTRPCSCTSKGRHGCVGFPLMVQMEDTPQAGPLWGLPPGPGSRPVFAVCCRGAERREDSCHRAWASCHHLLGSQSATWSHSWYKRKSAGSSVPSIAPHSPTSAHLQEHSLAIGAAVWGSEASEEGRNLQLRFRTMKCTMLIWLVHKIVG